MKTKKLISNSNFCEMKYEISLTCLCMKWIHEHWLGECNNILFDMFRAEKVNRTVAGTCQNEE